MNFEDWTNSDLEFELTLDRTKNDELRKEKILSEIQKRKIKSLEREIEFEKPKAPIVKFANFIITGALFSIIGIIALVITTTPSTSGYNAYAPILTKQLSTALPTGDIERYKDIFPREGWEQLSTEEAYKIFNSYRKLGKYKSHTAPVRQNVSVTTKMPYESIALYHATAAYENASIELSFNIAKISETEFKILNFTMNIIKTNKAKLKA